MVRAAYRHQLNVSYLDRDVFFGIPLSQRLQETGAAHLITWHTSIQAALKKAIKDFAKSSASGQTTLLQNKFKLQQEKLRLKPKPSYRKGKKGPIQPRQNRTNRRRTKANRKAYRQNTITHHFTTTKQADHNPNRQSDDNHPT
jgi:hypothetical protein